MYFYSAPFTIIKEKENYSVIDQLGGKYVLDKKALITALSVMGEKVEPEIIKELKSKFEINDVESIISSLLETEFLIMSKYKRRNPFNPKKVSKRILENQDMEKEILNLGTLTLASIKSCPYSCEGCYVDYHGNKKISETKLEKLEQTIEDAIKMGINHLTLSGGEVTVSESSVKRTASLAKFAHLNGLDSITVVTTGYQLEKYMSLFLDSGVTEFQISIDGFKGYNDKYKHFRGATERSFKAIEICQKNKIKYTTNTVVSKKNMDLINNFVEELVSKDVENIRLSKIITDRNDLMIDTNTAKLLEEKISKLKTKYSININGPFGNPYIMEDYINCVAGKLYAHIDFSGKVLPCAFMPDQIIGDINEQRLIHLWNLENPILKNLSEGIKLDSQCNECRDRYHCFGNCIRDYEYKRLNCKNE